MSISGVSSSTNNYSIAAMQNNSNQIKDYSQKLSQDLQSGDLSSAQQAFAGLQQLLPNLFSGNQVQTGQQSSVQNQIVTDLSTLGQALQSGDLSKAQDAFKKLQQDMQALLKGHHRHHRQGIDTTQDTMPASSNTSANAGSSDSSVGANVNVKT